MAPALTRSAREDQVREATRDARVRATARLFFSLPTAATVRKPSFARGARSDALAPAPRRPSPLAPSLRASDPSRFPLRPPP